MEMIGSKNIRVGELDIHYVTGGQGVPLIVIHGGLNGAGAWRKTVTELSKNYTVYVPDLPGFGHSEETNTDYYVPEYVDFVEEFAKSLGLESFYLMGHSLGGGIAANYALKSPKKVKKLVLVNSMFLGKEIALWIRFFSHPAFRYLGTATLAILKGVKWIADRILSPGKFVSPISRGSISLGRKMTTLKEQTQVLSQRLSEIMMPTLIIWGAKDPILPAQHAYAAAKLIPDCQVKVFADGGHSVYRQKPAEFIKLLVAFLG